MEHIQILPYSAELASNFKSINQVWVENLFSLEPFDRDQLDHPYDKIIAPGGAIIFAQVGAEIVGTVGLQKVSDTVFELIKMGVKESAQGKGIGLALGKAVLARAKEMGAQRVELYTHSKLKAALNIYRKLGFIDEVPEVGKYCRCDLKMTLAI